MDALTKAVHTKGISFTQLFPYNLNGEIVTFTVLDIIRRHQKSGDKEEVKNSVNHIKNSSSKIALSFLQGIGQQLAIEYLYGAENASKLQEVVMCLSYTEEPVFFSIGQAESAKGWVMERQGNKFYLYRQGENKPKAYTISEFFQRMLQFDIGSLKISTPR